MKLCFATNNAHKAEEVAALLGPPLQIQTLTQIGCHIDIPETGDTLEENSLLKAQYVFDHYGVDCFADDTGLEVAALDGAPGVVSARYAGEHKNSQENIDLLLGNLRHHTNRSAQFRAVITLILNGVVHQFEGIVRGQIIEKQRGSMGFGYDSVFVPDGYNTTFAEMTLDQKSTVSHRARAVEKLVVFLQNTQQNK